MLIIKAYINERERDEIRILNIGRHENSESLYRYQIIKPIGITRTFIHERNKGWRQLATQVLKHLNTLDGMDETI